MRTSNLIGVAALSSALLIGCGANRATVQSQPVYQQTAVSQPVDTAQQRRDREIAELKHRLEMVQLQKELDATLAEGISVEIPCLEYSMDDADYFRDYGIGTDEGNNMQNARRNALNDAKAAIRRHLSEFVQGLSTDYYNSYAGTTSSVNANQSKMEEEFMGLVEGKLNNVERLCEDHRLNERGQHVYYIAIQIPKKELMDEFVDVLSNDEKLGIDFKQQEFRKFAEDRMVKMQEAKKNAGY